VLAIEATLSLLGQISDRLRYLQPSVYSLLEYLCGNQQFEKLGYPTRCRALIREGKSFPESWRQAVGESAKILGAEEAEILAALADVLGCADLESQLAAIAYTRELLQGKLEEARTREKTYGKLYRTLGVLSGVAIVIVLF
jgi:stage III sporulation protein AB